MKKATTTALFRASFAAILLVTGGESLLVQGNHQVQRTDRNRKTMCFSNTPKEQTEQTAATTESSSTDFKVQTWNPFRLAVLRLGLTEFPATSPFNYGKYDGEFTCAYCGNLLFDSNAKYESGSGWPSFWRTAAGSSSVQYKRELDGRLECQCAKCSSHLGHVFLDGPTPSSVDPGLLAASPESDPRGQTNRYLPRFCMNGAAMKFRDRRQQVQEKQ